MFQYILFDWDGCLADTLPVWLKSYKKIFKEYGFSPRDEDIVNKVFGQWEGPKNIGVTNIQEFVDKLVIDVNNYLLTVNLHKNVLSTIKQLKKNKKNIAIITSSLKKQITSQLTYHHMTHLIDYIISAEDITKHKPDPEGINKILNYFQASKKDTIIIGDSDKDIYAGRNAGIKTAIFYPRLNHIFFKQKDLELLKPDYFFTDLRQMLDIV